MIIIVLIVFNIELLQFISGYGIPIGSEGLYTDDDQVIEYNSENFINSVYNQPFGILVEYFNSYCGHCRAFAPLYIELADDVARWNDVIRIAAVDCTAEINFQLCPTYRIKFYPTLRYFRPMLEFHTSDDEYLGEELEKSTAQGLRKKLIRLIKTDYPIGNYPDLRPIPEYSVNQHLFDDLPNSVKIIFLLKLNNKLLAEMIQLDLYSIDSIKVISIINDDDADTIFYLERNNRRRTVRRIELNIAKYSRAEIISTIFTTLERASIYIPDWILDNRHENKMTNKLNGTSEKDRRALINYVISEPFSVYMSDLEASLRHALFNEVAMKSAFNNRAIEAITNFVYIAKEYGAMNDRKIQRFLNKLYHWLTTTDIQITGYQFNKFVRIYDTEDPVFSRNRMIGCVGSKPTYRGYSCGLWQYFHYLTVQAAISPKSSDGGEVLQAIHGYMKYFYGCTVCQEHFQEMAQEDGLFDVTEHYEAVIWLWNAHNKVNNRLANDPTDDPMFPKNQFPTRNQCLRCKDGIWDMPALEDFLYSVYNELNTITIPELDHAIINSKS